jgi:hypothetical protein
MMQMRCVVSAVVATAVASCSYHIRRVSLGRKKVEIYRIQNTAEEEKAMDNYFPFVARNASGRISAFRLSLPRRHWLPLAET